MDLNHEHDYPVENKHTHSHSHAHTHEHEHDGAVHTQTGLVALMKYMVGHNAAHTRELTGLAAQLEQTGRHDAYEKVMSAIADFEKGNAQLADVLQNLEEK